MSRLLALAVATAAVILAAPARGTAVSAGSTNPLTNPRAETTCLADPTPAPDSLMLFNFEDAEKAQWSVESDRVMGGRSSGSVQAAGGTLTFTGEVVTEGGGFSSVRVGRQVDLTGYDRIELRVRGGGRTFELDVSDGTESRGREVNRRGPFPTRSSWKTVRVPFDSLEESAHGEPVSTDPLDLSAVKSIGIYIIDGKDGRFRLEVDWIRAYRESE
jgi:NADH dehydrogenase [ubiquinone] 1 alpha subcomplex assembly factor 1